MPLKSYYLDVYILFVWLGKFIKIIVRLVHPGTGTSVPGLVLEKIYPQILEKLARQIPHTVVITGTNGKTTAQTILGKIFEEAGIDYLANKSGSNMKRGIIAKLVDSCGWDGKIKSQYAIFEVEEATLPKIVRHIDPTFIIVTNLFRDQLDAYGEIDRTAKFIRNALENAPNAKLVLNDDDPRVRTLNEGLNNEVVRYGIDKKFQMAFKYESLNEKKLVPKNKEKQVAKDIEVLEDLSSRFSFMGTKYKLKIPGIFHIYNCAASIAVATSMGLQKEQIRRGVELCEPAFGRGEEISYDGIKYKIFLVKNPAGMDLSLEMLKNARRPTLIFALNDKIADGRDVSWIWDSKLEILNTIKPANIICIGIRAEDMLLRVKYALNRLVPEGDHFYDSAIDCNIYITPEMLDAHKILKHLEIEQNVYILPTYTAMLNIRKTITGQAINV